MLKTNKANKTLNQAGGSGFCTAPPTQEAEAERTHV